MKFAQTNRTVWDSLRRWEERVDKQTVLLTSIFNYCCPIKILQRNKNRADFICEVSPFLLDFCRQTKSIQLWAKVYILADSRSMVR